MRVLQFQHFTSKQTNVSQPDIKYEWHFTSHIRQRLKIRRKGENLFDYIRK